MGSSESRDLKVIRKYENTISLNKEACAICLESMADDIAWLPCTHCYHNTCLVSWENKCKEKNREITCCMCGFKYL